MNETIIPIEHRVFNGLYTRIAFAKAGTVVIGCTHNKSGKGFLLSGSIRQSDDDGEYIDFKAPHSFCTTSGSQRYAFALEDTIYATIHEVDSLNVEDAEKELFVEQPQITRIKNDYKLLLNELNIQEPIMESCTIEKNDNIYFDKSEIDGIGCFSNRFIKQGEVIAITILDNERLSTSRFVNHSDIPNVKLFDSEDKNTTYLMSLVDIEKGNELFLNYRRRLICQQQ